MDALRTRGGHHVAEQLLPYVRYPWPRAVEHAVEALVALNCKEAIPQLAVMYDQPDPDAPFCVVSGIPAPAPGAGVLPPRPDPAPVVPPVAVAMKPDVVIANVGIAVAVLVLRASEESALEAHTKSARDPDPKVRRGAAEGLAPFLTNPNEVVRRKVAQTLAELGADAEPATAALREAVKDPDGDVRKSVRLALEKIDEAAANAKAAKTRENILAIAKDLKAKEPATRIKALGQIAVYGREANFVGEQLIEAMVDKVPAVQVAASEALEKVSPKVHPHIFTLLFGMEKRGAVRDIGELGPEAAIAAPLLIYLYDNPPTNTGPIGKKGGTTVVTVPVRLGDVLSVIAKIAPKDKRFASLVLATITAPIPREDAPPAGVGARLGRRLEAMGQLKTIEADNADKVKALLAALGDGAGIIQVVEALGEIGKDAEPALPSLKKLKLSTNDSLRKAATEAIAKIE